MDLQEKLTEIGQKRLLVGIDAAKDSHWAVIGDIRGKELMKPFRFDNNQEGFNLLERRIKSLGSFSHSEIMLGLEPTGLYWKPLGMYLKNGGYRLVLVNPSHTHKTKELQDNSQTKHDKKDARLVQTLIREGKFLEPIILKGDYARLRRLIKARESLIKRSRAVQNKIKGMISEYFPELGLVCKVIKGKTVMSLLKEYPFPKDIQRLGKEALLAKLKFYGNNRFGKAKTQRLWELANTSIGLKEAQDEAKLELRQLIEEYELLDRQRKELEAPIRTITLRLPETKYIIQLPGIKYLSIARLLSETGPLKNYTNSKEIEKLAGLNLVENSSGKHISGKTISKRGRKLLRYTGYQIALSSIRNNPAIKYEYKYRIEQLKQSKMQALIAISAKMLRIIFCLATKERQYDQNKVSKHYYLSQIKSKNRIKDIYGWVRPIEPPSGSSTKIEDDTVYENIGHPLSVTLDEVMSGSTTKGLVDDTVRNDRVRRRDKKVGLTTHRYQKAVL
jgi:transposase